MRFLKKNNKFQFLKNLVSYVLFSKKNYKNKRGWGGRGNLGFPTLAQAMSF